MLYTKDYIAKALKGNYYYGTTVELNAFESALALIIQAMMAVCASIIWVLASIPLLSDLLDYVKLDAIHSWEDTIEPITDAKRSYGDRLSLLGGIDVDFLCRASESQIRDRVGRTVETCQPGGGFCLGSGNSVANYIPVDNYLVMMDEGRKC